MSQTGRRQFLQGLGAAAMLSPLGSLAFGQAAQGGRGGAQAGRGAAPPTGRGGAAPQFDFIIKGGKVIDPTQKISSVMDVAIKGDKVAAVAANIPAAEARNVYEATGKIVTAGLIDSHGHVYDGGITTSIEADVVGIAKGTTTIVDAGSAGAANFAGLRKYVIERAHTRVYSLLNIGMNGCCNNEIYGDPRLVDARAAIDTIEANRPYILGIKVRINGKHDELAHDVEVLKKAREAADATRTLIMMHWSNEPELHALLRRGDIITHPYNPPSPNSSNLMGGEPGKILPQVFALKDKGIWTDFSHGGHLAWAVAEESAKQGWFPDTISTDIHRGHVPPVGVVYDLATTMSKFLYLGLTVDQAVEKVTAMPKKIFPFPEKIGSLEPGTVADVTISEVRTGDFDFYDSRRDKRVGHQKFVPTATVKSGSFMYWEP
jgi:dihydroorotase